MLRSLSLLFVAACVVPVGCRSPNSYNPFAPCGTRVPPPSTGSYGSPNTYYPNATPRASAAPSNAPRALNPSLGGWRTSNDDSGAGLTALTGESSAPGSSGTATGSSVRVGPASTGVVRAPTTTSVAGQPRLNGMRVNEVKPPVAPASFQSPVTTSETKGGPGSSAGAAGGSPQQPSSNPPSNNALRNSSASLRTDSWQSRSAPAPAPNRIAGS